jgi:hypothetical protein
LADSNFNSPGKIDLLMGAEVFMELLLAGKFKLKGNLLWMQETYFGWVFSGAFVLKKDNHQSLSCHVVTNEDLQSQLEKLLEGR